MCRIALKSMAVVSSSRYIRGDPRRSRGPAVTVTASAADLLKARLGATEATRLMALERIKFDGDQDAVDRLRKVFRLTADPGSARRSEELKGIMDEPTELSIEHDGGRIYVRDHPETFLR